jgi:hypothetical protein
VVIPLHTPRPGIRRNGGPAWTGIAARLAPELWPGMDRNTHEPVAGRFLGVDPIMGIGISQDVNSYSYAWNNPLNVTDPSGFYDRDMTVHQCISCDWQSFTEDWVIELVMDILGAAGEYREPTIDEKRRWVFFKPGDDVDVIAPNAQWDGQNFVGTGVMYGADEANSPTEVTGPYGEKIFIPVVLPEDTGYRPLSHEIFEIIKTRHHDAHQRMRRLATILEALEQIRDKVIQIGHEIGDGSASDRLSEFGVMTTKHIPDLLGDLDQKIETINDAINDIGEIYEEEQGVPLPYSVEIKVARWPTGKDFFEIKVFLPD